jgi:DNA modification methylase
MALNVRLHLGDCLDVLRSIPDQEVQTCVTSPAG